MNVAHWDTCLPGLDQVSNLPKPENVFANSQTPVRKLRLYSSLVSSTIRAAVGGAPPPGGVLCDFHVLRTAGLGHIETEYFQTFRQLDHIKPYTQVPVGGE